MDHRNGHHAAIAANDLTPIERQVYERLNPSERSLYLLLVMEWRATAAHIEAEQARRGEHVAQLRQQLGGAANAAGND